MAEGWLPWVVKSIILLLGVQIAENMNICDDEQRQQ